MKINNFFKFIIAIVSCQLAGVVGSVFTISAIPLWYENITKPALNPPAWVFGPVWMVLYFMMGVAAFLVWRKGLDKRGVKIALIFFDLQLILNVFWSVIFFGFRNPGGAFIEIIFLWLAIFTVIILFSKISYLASWLLFPYIVWVGFAGYLNFSIWQLSKNYTEITCSMEAKLCPDGSAVGRAGPNCEFAECSKISE